MKFSQRVVAFAVVLCCASPMVGRADSSSPIAVVEAFESVLTGVFERSKASVVAVSARDVRNISSFRRLTEESSVPIASGTGFVIREDGYVVTNDHVVHNAAHVDIRFADGTTMEAKIVGVDPNTDIAVLKVETKDPLLPLSLADSDAAKIGQFVVSVGNPFGLDFSANIGIISAKGRSDMTRDSGIIRYQDFIQTDAYLNRGGSGGPLLNLRGEVVGMNTMIRTGPGSDFTGIGFAVPSKMIQVISEQLVNKGQVVRGWFGVTIRPADEGIRIMNVLVGSPAEKSGLKSRDIITTMNGQPIRETKDFSWTVAMTPVGSPVAVSVLRDGETKTFDVVVGEMPARQAGREELPQQTPLLASFGLAVDALEAGVAELYDYAPGDSGVRVLNVEDDSPAEAAGFMSRDLIVKVGDKPVQTPTDCETAVQEARKNGANNVEFLIKSGARSRKVSLPLKKE